MYTTPDQYLGPGICLPLMDLDLLARIDAKTNQT